LGTTQFVDKGRGEYHLGQATGVAVATAIVTTAAASILAPASISTPYAVEVQSMSAEAQAALAEARGGATLYRVGELGESMAGESQYWSLENPLLNSNYANQIGMPGVSPNFLMTGTLNPGAAVVTNEAAGLGANLGGAIQVVTTPGGVGGLSFISF
jgi:hypothetical protein